MASLIISSHSLLIVIFQPVLHLEQSYSFNYFKYDTTNIASKLSNKKTPSTDRIHNKIVQFLDEKFSNLICTSVNKCLYLQLFPDYWKAANIKLLKKSGKNLNFSNAYRLIY